MAEQELISRTELTAYLFAVADIHEDVRRIRQVLDEEEDDEAGQDDA